MNTNNIRFALAAVALAVAGTANASTINWGSITAPDTKGVSNSFSYDDYGNFSDRYNFTLTNDANSFGGVVERDPAFSLLDIDLTSVSLFQGGTLIGTDWSPGAFSFADLGAGSYSFFVNGKVGLELGLPYGEVGYRGNISFTPTAVPEPNTLALAGIGLLGVAFAMRRRFSN